jgi:dTDP-glucose pyrophosphorylase/predicted transcriptional regulator
MEQFEQLLSFNIHTGASVSGPSKTQKQKFKQVFVGPHIPIKEAIAKLEQCSSQIVLVVDEQKKLVGTITDGDIRRGILRGVRLEEAVRVIMNPDPTTALFDEGIDLIFEKMKRLELRQIPLVDEDNRVVGLEILSEIISPVRLENPIVLMAGGFGSRLKPLTDDCPKPLLRVGNKPVIETILENLIKCGFHNFHFAVNYKAHLFEEHFGNGSNWNVNINYLREPFAMGTAGALTLLSETQGLPLLIMNGDVLTTVNFKYLLDFHRETQSVATMCIREHSFQVQFGVVKVDKNRILNIDEKPVQKFFVNAGIYVLNPEVLNQIPREQKYDMPKLFDHLILQNKTVSAFPIREYWLDIGQAEDFQRAHQEFGGVFG